MKTCGYWIICVQTYHYDGEEIPKGRMEYYESQRPIMSHKWRRATAEEVESMKNFNGNWYNLTNV